MPVRGNEYITAECRAKFFDAAQGFLMPRRHHRREQYRRPVHFQVIHGALLDSESVLALTGFLPAALKSAYAA